MPWNGQVHVTSEMRPLHTSYHMAVVVVAAAAAAVVQDNLSHNKYFELPHS